MYRVDDLMEGGSEEKRALMLLKVAEWWGGYKQKHCYFFREDGLCAICYDEPIDDAPVEWVEEGGKYLMRPSQLWCLYCAKHTNKTLAHALEL